LFQMTSAMPSTLTPPVAGAAEFRGWYESHADYVWRSLRRLGVPPSDLPDLSHDVFVVAWKQQAHLDAERPAKAWLFGVAFRVASSHRRRSWFRRRKEWEIDTVAASGVDPEQRALLQAELNRLQTALEEVPLKVRAVLLLHDFDEVPLKEIATTLGLKLQTAYSRLALARKRFRQAFRRGELQEFSLARDQVALGEQR
jgi:RNA polymerase sigma-70 factor, ECF subfamily